MLGALRGDGTAFDGSLESLEGAGRFFWVAGLLFALLSLCGSCSKSPYAPWSTPVNRHRLVIRTANVCIDLSAALLVLARLARVSLPASASFNIPWAVALLGFSKTKNTKDRMAKKIVYM